MDDLPKEVHVSARASAINSFSEVDRSNLMCFRCGQTGHVRSQCLTYKVRPCNMYENGKCTDVHCSFAHGAKELREPWRARCIRVIKQGDRLVCIGCNSETHTFRKCPLHADLLFM